MVRVAPLANFIKSRYGLLDSVPVETVEDKHWQSGEPIEYLAAPCGAAVAYPLGVCDPETGLPLDVYGEDGKPAESMVTVEACGLEVVYGAKCSARVLNDPDYDIRGMAQQGLECKESVALESAIWNNSFDCYEVENVCPDPVKPYQALAALENAMIECSGLGYIHVPAALLPHLCDCLNQVQGLLRTKAGSIVVVGNGYGDMAGDGSSTTILGTGPIRLFKGDLRFSPDEAEGKSLAAVNRGQNEVVWRAERSWAIGFDPCCPVFSATAEYC